MSRIIDVSRKIFTGLLFVLIFLAGCLSSAVFIAVWCGIPFWYYTWSEFYSGGCFFIIFGMTAMMFLLGLPDLLMWIKEEF